MHPRLAAVIDFVDRARTELLVAVDAVPEPLREARPSENEWSVAEIVEHLARVEKGIAKLVALKVGELQAMPEPPREATDAAPSAGDRFATILNRATRLEAPERVAPKGEMSAEAALSELKATRGMLLDQLHAGDGLAYSAVIHPHPIFGPIDLYEWVHFVGAHELRHVEQIRDVARQLSVN